MIIGLAGYAQAGKDTVGGILVERFGFKRISFADKMRECLYALNPVVIITNEWLLETTGDRLATVVDRYGWEQAKKFDEVRELLQRCGTEAGRDVLGPDVWVHAALRDVRESDAIVVTDVRFPNEAEYIQKHLEGKVVRVERPGAKPVNAHSSEVAMDGWDYDAQIDNNLDMAHLEEVVVAWAVEQGL